MMDKIEIIYDKQLRIIIDISHLNIHIVNSYKVKEKEEINFIIENLMRTSTFKILKSAGFTRTKSSMVREWCAHNYLYFKAYKVENTRDVDLNQNESILRRLGYFFLSLLYK